jgi:hypothetical protein
MEDGFQSADVNSSFSPPNAFWSFLNPSGNFVDVWLQSTSICSLPYLALVSLNLYSLNLLGWSQQVSKLF